MKPVPVEVVSNVLTVFSHCSSCAPIFRSSGVEDEANKEILQEYPAELREEFLKLSAWIRELNQLYGPQIRISLVDAKSFLGIYKSLIHRFRKYPTFIIDKKVVLTGWDQQKLKDLLDIHVKAEDP